MTKYIEVKTRDTKTFGSQDGAREYIKKLMDAGLLFLEVSESEEDVFPEKPEEIPALKPMKKVTKSNQKLPGSQLYDSGVKKKVNKEIIEFIKDNCLTKDNEMLVKSIKSRFGVNTTINSVKYWMSRNGISRRRMKQEAAEANGTAVGEKQLKTLPPEDNY